MRCILGYSDYIALVLKFTFCDGKNFMKNSRDLSGKIKYENVPYITYINMADT